MELKGLRAFVKVADFGNISQAAISLGLTQSSVSRIIAALERDLGSPLFYRTGRGVALTEAGKAAIDKARSIVIGTDQLIVDVRDFGQAPSGTVTLAMLPWLMRHVGGSLFDHVRRAYPNVFLRMMEGYSLRNEEWLADGRVDIAILSRYRKVRSQREELMVVSDLSLVGPQNASTERRTIGFRELAKLPLVLPSSPNGLRVAVNAVARRLKLELNIVAEADSFEAQKAIVSSQRCYMVLTPQTVEREVASGLFRASTIVNPKIPRLVVMATTTHRPLSRAAREVTAILRKLIRSI